MLEESGGIDRGGDLMMSRRVLGIPKGGAGYMVAFDLDGDATGLKRHLYRSKDYLMHLFREYAGESPIKYILRVRLEKAKALLADKHLRIGEIATQCGFE